MISFTLEIVFFYIILICLSVSSNKVVLIAKYTPEYMTLTCKAEDSQADMFMIHLSCPLVKSGFCYSNCTSHCKLNNFGRCVRNPSLNAISKCQYDVLNQNTISTSYIIRNDQIYTTGDWSCSFKNYKSNAISLAKYDHPTKITTSAINTVPILIKNVDNERRKVIANISTRSSMSQITTVFTEKYQTNPTIIYKEFNFLNYVTRPELVLVLILLLGVSLLLNLSFLIRCVLLKFVIENYYRGIPNGQCILECLCLDLASNKYANRTYSRNLNLSNQVGSDFYRCQQICTDNTAIYDDLSAVSNSSARIKLRSNHSSEMDEESRLTTLIPNGGCHINPMGVGSVSSSLTRRYTNPSHAAYFHPGLGNYVIVSGPVASHEQYSAGTVPSGYTLQMVSPIPSAPGSIGGAPGSMGGAPGTHHSTPSAHSDESDNDSRTTLSASMTTGIPYRPTRINSQPIDFRNSSIILDHYHNMMVPINGLEHPLYLHHENHNNFIRPNGSVPLHPWPKESVIPTTSSISSLPYYTVSENGVYMQEIQNKNVSAKLPTPPKDGTITES